MQVTETTIQEKDQRIGELDRLIERMEEVGELTAALTGNAPSAWRKFQLLFCCSAPCSVPYHCCLHLSYCIYISKCTWIATETLWWGGGSLFLVVLTGQHLFRKRIIILKREFKNHSVSLQCARCLKPNQVIIINDPESLRNVAVVGP